MKAHDWAGLWIITVSGYQLSRDASLALGRLNTFMLESSAFQRCLIGR